MTIFPGNVTLSICESSIHEGYFLIKDLSSIVWNYLFKRFLVFFAYWSYLLHKDRISQIRGQRTSGVAESGNKDKRVSIH